MHSDGLPIMGRLKKERLGQRDTMVMGTTPDEWQELVSLLHGVMQDLERRDAKGAGERLADLSGTLTMLGLGELGGLTGKLETFLSEQIAPHWEERAVATMVYCLEEMADRMRKAMDDPGLSLNVEELLVYLEKFPTEIATHPEGDHSLAASATSIVTTPTGITKIADGESFEDAHMNDLKTLKSFLEIDPTSRVFVPLTEKLCERQMWEEAAETCRKGLTYHPDNVYGQILLGWALFQSGQAVEAETVLEQARLQWEKGALLYRLLGQMAENRGASEEADELYHRHRTLSALPTIQISPEKSTEEEGPGAVEAPPPAAPDQPRYVQFLDSILAEIQNKVSPSSQSPSLLSGEDREKLKSLLRRAGKSEAKAVK